ncbi:MAG: RadC family protein [Clostridia bacterium]|nr:RadC family protein [Clostridia bacterium]
MEHGKTKPEHEGHRKRIKERYLEYGIDSLDDKDIIELLLTYAIPRKDVYEIARGLFHKYGSLANLLATDPEVLASESRLSTHTTVLLKLVNDLRSRPDRSVEYRSEPITNLLAAARYTHRILGGFTKETIIEIFLDHDNVVTEITKAAHGDEDSVVLPIERIVRDAVRMGVARMLIAHNHPSGNPAPSEADILATTTLERALISRGIVLLEHFIVTGSECTAILHDQRFTMEKESFAPWREPEGQSDVRAEEPGEI